MEAHTFRGVKREMALLYSLLGSLRKLSGHCVGNEPLQWITPVDPPQCGGTVMGGGNLVEDLG